MVALSFEPHRGDLNGLKAWNGELHVEHMNDNTPATAPSVAAPVQEASINLGNSAGSTLAATSQPAATTPVQASQKQPPAADMSMKFPTPSPVGSMSG